MEKFVVFGRYCEDAIIKREPFREQHLKRLKKLKDVNSNPIAVGFGISTPEHVNKVRKWGADGVIIGSAFVKRISSSSEKDVVDHVGDFCKEMRLAADQKK